MAFDIHTIDIKGGTVNNALASPAALVQQDRLLLGFVIQVPTLIGGSAGASVVTTVSGFNLPVNSSGVGTYGVVATPNQDATVYVTSKTATGFTLTLDPRLAANTLAAGTVDLLIWA